MVTVPAFELLQVKYVNNAVQQVCCPERVENRVLKAATKEETQQARCQADILQHTFARTQTDAPDWEDFLFSMKTVSRCWGMATQLDLQTLRAPRSLSHLISPTSRVIF